MKLIMNTTEYIESYYVDSENGNDNNPGTVERPFQSIQKGIDAAGINKNDGNQVYLQGGIYNLTQPLEINPYNGEPDDFLTIKSLPGEQAILDGSQVSTGGGLINVRDVGRINIIGLEIRNAPSHGIEVVNGKYVNIVDNLIYNTQGMGIRVRGYMGEDLVEYESDTTVQSSNIVIDSNGVYQTNLSNSGKNKGINNWGAGIQAWNANDVAIVNNTVGENYGEGIGFSLVNNGLVANNTLYDNFSVQIYLDNVADSVVETNFIRNTGDHQFYRNNFPAHGIAMANEIYNVAQPERFYLKDNLIQRNIIVGANSGIIYGNWAGRHQNQATNNFQGLKNTTIVHNTVYDSKSYSIRFDEDTNNNEVRIYNNIFYQESDHNLSSIDNLTGIYFGRNLWFGGKSGDGSSSKDIVADPQFINPGGDKITDYQLQADSAAIDVVKGDESYWVSNNQGDLGALEFGEPVFDTGDAD